MPVVRCIECDHETAQAGLSCCPRCETGAIPLEPVDDVLVRVNWRELRILVIYGERLGSCVEGERGLKTRRLVRAIARRLEAQHAERAKGVPLTFSGELELLRQQGLSIKQTFVEEDREPPSMWPPNEEEQDHEGSDDR